MANVVLAGRIDRGRLTALRVCETFFGEDVSARLVVDEKQLRLAEHGQGAHPPTAGAPRSGPSGAG